MPGRIAYAAVKLASARIAISVLCTAARADITVSMIMTLRITLMMILPKSLWGNSLRQLDARMS